MFVKRKSQLLITVPYSFMGAAYGVLDRFGCERTGEVYLDTGDVQLAISAEADQVAGLTEAVVNASKGQGKVEPAPPTASGDSEEQ